MVNEANAGCIYDIITNLDRIFTEINVFAKAYRMLREVEQEEKHAQQENRQVLNVSMVFNRDRTLDRQ